MRNRSTATENIKLKLLGFIVLICTSAFLIAQFRGGYLSTIIMSISVGFILWITKTIWLPKGFGSTRVKILSLNIALIAVLSYTSWQAFFETLFINVLRNYFPAFNNEIPKLPPTIAFIFLSIVIWIVNSRSADRTGMGIHPIPISKDIPEPEFNERLLSLCDALYDDLRSIDIKTKWSSKNFVPLDAEVEIIRHDSRHKKVTDLHKAIRTSDERVFLILGEPGSGKSVALRKLCQDLIKEVKKTGKIPVYINLKEWQTDKKWDSNNKPTVDELQKFVISNLKSRDIVASRFFDKYFDILHETGRLYYIFDSFDEIPSVLDEKENSDLIHSLSEVLFRFLKGARAKNSQGILASRIFRKPTFEFQTQIVLEIRPFNEEKIEQAFRNQGVYTKELVRQLFSERIELYPVAQNPFTATLLAEYIESNNNTLPSNQLEIYESFVSKTLDACKERINKKKLTKDLILQCSMSISQQMFLKYGLEAPINKLRLNLKEFPIDDVVDILKFARIGRVGTGDENQFSFVHRRFCEYFAVKAKMAEGSPWEYLTIPTDSQWRDALVLYCEVAPELEATRIANYCWETIKTVNNAADSKSIHTLRFLTDAFKARRECLNSFREELSQYLLGKISQTGNIIQVKIAVESLVLLNLQDINLGLKKSLALNNDWISETAIKAYRYIPRLDKELEEQVIRFFSKCSSYFIIKRRRQTLFSLSLTEGFMRIQSFYRNRLLDSLLFYFMLFAFSILCPAIGIMLPKIRTVK